MRKTIGLTTFAGALGACLCLSAADALKPEEERPFYAKVDLGGNWTRDLDLKEYFGPVTPGSKLRLDPGFRAGLTGGYDLTSWFAPEVQLGLFENRVKDVTGATEVHDVTFANAPFLVNAKFQLRNKTRFTPYAGAGTGFSVSIMDARHLELNGTTLHGSAADVVWAYQGFAGVRFALNDRMGLSLEYRYFAAEGARWKADTYTTGMSDVMRAGRTETQAIGLAFDYHF